MANYSTARWEAFQYKLNELMNKPENKHAPSPTLMLRLRNTDFLIGASEKERAIKTKKSDQDTVYVNILKLQSISTGSARAAAHTGSKNDSERTTANFTTYDADFAFSMKSSQRTIWSQAEQYAQGLLSAAIALHAAIESDMVTALNTNRNQSVISETPQSCGWDASNFIAQIAGADKERWMQRLKGFMREQYYNWPVDAIVDEYLYQEAVHVLSQGGGNATNYGYQAEGLGLSVSQGLTLPSGYDGVGFAAPVGSLGVLPWIPEMNEQGFGDPGSVGGFYTKIPDPLGSGLEFAVHERYVAADNENTDGETQDINVHVEVSVDLAPIDAPMSTSNANPVNKFGLLQ